MGYIPKYIMKNSAEKIGMIRVILVNGIWSEYSDIIIKLFVIMIIFT